MTTNIEWKWYQTRKKIFEAKWTVNTTHYAIHPDCIKLDALKYTRICILKKREKKWKRPCKFWKATLASCKIEKWTTAGAATYNAKGEVCFEWFRNITESMCISPQQW